jgi:hypothetical protein
MGAMLLDCSSLSSLKTGIGWVGDVNCEDGRKPRFPCDMIDESKTTFLEDDIIPEGAHTYTAA